MSFAETAELMLCSRTAKEISGSEVREGWGAFGTVHSSTIHLLVIVVSNPMAPYMSTRRAAPGLLPLKVGCMFSRMDAFNPLHRYHQMRSSIPSVDGQMWCGWDVNAGD